MFFIEIPAPPRFLTVIVAVLTFVSFIAFKIGEYYLKDENKKLVPALYHIEKRYHLKIAVKEQSEGEAVLKILEKEGLKGTIVSKSIDTMVPKGYVVKEYFPETVGKTVAEALKIHDYIVTVESQDKEKVAVRVGEIFHSKAKAYALALELNKKGYVFSIQTYEESVKKVLYWVELRKIAPDKAEMITNDFSKKGYKVEKQEELIEK